MTKLSTKFAQISKRAVALLSSVAIVVAGLVAGAAAPASATGTPASNSGAVDSSWTYTKYWTDASQPLTFTVPSGATGFTVRTYAATGSSYGGGHTYADTLIDQTLAVTGGLYDSNNTLMTSGISYSYGLVSFGTNTSYPASNPSPCVASASCSFNGSNGHTPTYFAMEKSLNNGKVGPTGAVQVGQTYTYKLGYTVNGVAHNFDNPGSSTDTGMPLNGSTYVQFTGVGPTDAAFPTGGQVTIKQTSCIDTTSLSTGDAVTARWVQDGAVIDPSNLYAPITYWFYGAQSYSQISNNDSSLTDTHSALTLQSANLTDGARLRFEKSITTDGNPHTFDMSLRSANGTEVSKSCAPDPVAKPSFASITSASSYSLSIPANTQSYGDAASTNNNKAYNWQIFDASDTATPVLAYSSDRPGTANPVVVSSNTTWVSGSSFTFLAGHSYRVKVQVVNNYTGLNSAWSELSDAFAVSGPPQMDAPTLSITSLNSARVSLTALANTDYYRIVLYGPSNTVVNTTDCDGAPYAAGASINCAFNGATLVGGTQYTATISRKLTTSPWWSIPSTPSASASYTPPAAPTNVVLNAQASNGGAVQVSFTGGVAGATGYQCAAFAVTTSVSPHTIASNSLATGNATTSATTCTVSSSFTTGSTIVVKMRTSTSGGYSDYSAATAEFVIPAPTWTLSTPSGHGNTSGSVNVSSGADLTTVTSSTTTMSPDLKGDVYKLTASTSLLSSPPITTYRLKKIKSSTHDFDLSFGTAGEVTWDLPSDASASIGTLSVFADGSWVVSVSKSTGGRYVYEGTTSGLATGQPVTVASTSLVTWCNANQTDITTISSSLSFQSAPTARPTATVTCSASGGLNSDVLLAKYASDGSLTKIAQVTFPNNSYNDGTNTITLAGVYVPSAAALGSIQYSTNPNATAGSDVALAVLVSDLTSGLPATIADRRLIRVTKDGVATVTHAAYPGGTGNLTANEPAVRLASSFDGTTIYATKTTTALVNGMPTETVSLIKAVTGGFDASNDVTLHPDNTAGWSQYPTVLWYIGAPSFVPNSGNFIQLRRYAFPTTSVSPTVYALAKVNLTTGDMVTGETFSATKSSTTLYSYGWTTASGNYITLLNPTDIVPAATKYYETTNVFAPDYVAPNSGPTFTSASIVRSKNAGGGTLTITGTNLGDVTKVKFGTVEVAPNAGGTSTSISVTIPTLAGTTATLVALALKNSGSDVAAGNFNYLGNGLTQTVSVDAGATTATVGDVDRSVTATVTPAEQGLSVGAATLSVSPSNVCTVVSNKVHFVGAGTCTVTETAAATTLHAQNTGSTTITVSGAAVVSPTVTSTTGSLFAKNTPVTNTTLQITGTHLDLVSAVKFGTTVATIKSGRSATSLTVAVPNGTGVKAITLVYSGGTVPVADFTYTGTAGATQTVTLSAGASTANVGDADRTVSTSVTASVTGAQTSSTAVASSTSPAICTLVNGTLHFVSNGLCSLTATVAASNWAQAGTSAVTTITVSNAPTISTNQLLPAPIGDSQYFIPATSTSDGVLRYSASPAGVCVMSTDVDTPNLVVEIATGECTISITQDASPASYWLAVTTAVTLPIEFTTAPISDPNAVDQSSTTVTGDATITDAQIAALNPATLSAIVMPKTGQYRAYQEAGLSWVRASGTLTARVKSVYVGPLTTTIAFTSGGKKYTCKVTYGATKKVATRNAVNYTSTKLCGSTSASDKKALPLLKALAAGTKIVVVTTFEKHRTLDYKLKKGKNRFTYKFAAVLQ